MVIPASNACAKAGFKMSQVALTRIGCNSNDSLLAGSQHLVCFGVAAVRFRRRFTVLFIAYRVEPYRRIGLRIGGDSDMCEPTVRCGSVPMHDIRRYFHDVARKQPTGGLSFFLIVAYACGCYQQLGRLCASANCCGNQVRRLHLPSGRSTLSFQSKAQAILRP